MSFLSSIVLYDVVWGTAIPVFSCLCICLAIVFRRSLRYFLKNNKSVCDYLKYLMRCNCLFPHDPIDQKVLAKREEQNQAKENENSEKGQVKDENENEGEGDEGENPKETPLEAVTTSS